MTKSDKLIILSVVFYTIVLSGSFLYNSNKKDKRINYLETELRSIRYHYLKCSTALLDSNLHKNCYKFKD
jgi:hypothetical protein